MLIIHHSMVIGDMIPRGHIGLRSVHEGYGQGSGPLKNFGNLGSHLTPKVILVLQILSLDAIAFGW